MLGQALSLLIVVAGGFLGSVAAMSLDRWIIRRQHRALLERLRARARRVPVTIAVAEEDLEPGDAVVIDLANKTMRRAR